MLYQAVMTYQILSKPLTLDLIETLDLFFASPVYSLNETCTKIKRHEFVDGTFFYQFYSLHFSVGRVLMIASPSEIEVQSFHEVQS